VIGCALRHWSICSTDTSITPADVATFGGGSNTQANAFLEVTIPVVEIPPGEGMELGGSSELTYVDGQRASHRRIFRARNRRVVLL